MKNELDKQYIDLLKDILENGIEKDTRNGKVLSVFGRSIRYKFKDSKFPLLTTKRIHFKSVITELLWFLQGRTDLKWLLDHGNTIWVGDAFKNYLNTYKGNFEMDREEFIEAIQTNDEFAATYGNLGEIYGKQWRKWHTSWDVVEDKSREAGVRRIENGIDQIANLINDLKTNPDSRRLMVNSWNVGELSEMTLPPCHYGFQVYTRELSLEERYNLIEKDKHTQFVNWQSLGTDRVKEVLDEKGIPTRAISLMFNMRSCDAPLGLPFNIASYGLLLEIIARMVNMVPDELIGNLGDVHIYKNQIEGVKEQLGRELTYEERYQIWFTNNFETGMEYNPEIVPDFDNPYYESTPKRTREPYPLPKLKHLKTDDFYKSLSEDLSLFSHLDWFDFELENYKSHSPIKMPLSN